MGGYMELAKRGSRISLAKSPFFFQGEFGINLRQSGEKTTVVPKDIEQGMLDRINHALARGALALGWAEEEKVAIPEDKELGTVIQQGRKKIEDFIYALLTNKSIGNDNKIKKLEIMLDLEKAGNNQTKKPRVGVLGKIEGALSKMAGVSEVKEEDKVKIEIPITKGTEEQKE